MSSSNKFPSGLNNWAGSDTPTRLDFVGDNEILDQNAMWKDSYDDDGAVIAAGGIKAFAMSKDLYDNDGLIALAGGIADAIQNAVGANEGYSSYLHSKSGAVHTLTGTGGNNIKFTATGGYSEGDTFSVDTVACTCQTADGRPLADGCFVSGSVVICYRNGNVLNFKTGGTVLNYRVVVSAVRPDPAHENTLWVQSLIPLNRYAISSVRPSNFNQTGDVHIRTGSGNTKFNVLANNVFTIEPQVAFQRDSTGEWILCPLEYYDGTQWTSVTSTLWLLNGAETFNQITGGWVSHMTGSGWYDYYGLGLGRIPNPYEFFPGGGSANKIADKVTTLPVDLTGVTLLTLDYTGFDRFGDGGIGTPQNFLYITSVPGGNHVSNAVAFTKTTYTGRNTMTLNVTSYNGPYYIGAGMSQSGYATNGIHIWSVWGSY